MGTPIRLGNLATHTSGLASNPPNRVDVEGTWRPYSVSELYAALAQTRLAAAPGTNYRYSNYGFALLGHVLERAAGVSYEKALAARVLQPLGMHDTSITLDERRRRRLAAHYWPEDSPETERRAWSFGAVAGFGGLTSSIRDMAAYLRFQLGRHEAAPISAASRSEAHRVRRLMFGWSWGIGLAWQVANDPLLGDLVQHGGEVDGHSSFFAFSPVEKVGVVVLANMGRDSAGRLGEFLLQDLILRSRAAREPSTGEARRHLASFDFATARWALDRVLTRAPKPDAEVLFDAGVTEARVGDHSRAIDLFGRARAAGADAARTAYRLARLHAARGSARDALRELAAAFEAGFHPRDRAWSAREFIPLLSNARFRKLVGLPAPRAASSRR